MLKSYFKIAWRNIIKNPFYSLVNIIGLSVGIAFTLLIAAFVWGEVQVNHQLKNAGNQYIIQGDWKDPSMGNALTTVAELPRALKQAYPNLVANYYRWDGVSSIVSKGDKHFTEGIQLGDSTLLNMFGFKLIHGDARSALNEPFSAVITKATAIKFFGNADVVGQTLNIANFANANHDFIVTGVLDKLPKNSVTNVNDDNNNGIFLLTAAAKFMQRGLEGWSNIYIVGYVELNPGINPDDLKIPMHNLIKKNASAQISDNLSAYLVPLKTYYLSGVKRMLYTMSYVGLFILLMAVINYVNMCVSRSSSRLREMGIRKVLGGMRKQLIWQFLAESVLLVAISTFVALLIYIVARPFFSSMLGQDMASLFSFAWYIYTVPFIFVILVGMLAGIYPALVLTALRSVDALKGKLATVNDNVFVRKALVGFQFGIAIVVLISAVVISQQVSLFFGKDLGYDKDLLVYARTPRDWSAEGVRKMETIRDELAQTPDISSISLSYSIPNGAAGGSAMLYKFGADSTKAASVTPLITDGQYAATYHIPVLAGSFFNPQFTPGDERKVVINKTQAIALGWRDVKKAIGQQIRILDYPAVFTICGVTADHQFGSMQWQIPSIVFISSHYVVSYRYFTIKLRQGNLQQRLANLEKNWNRLLPGAPFEYKFMDESLAKMYKNELQLQKAAYTATILSTIIVLLGVLGLISLSVQKRTREIGIRKVLGSSASAISVLFLKDTLVIVMIAGVVACPVAWLVMHHWLADYAHKVSLSAMPFLASVSILTVVTALIIILQTIKAAFANPVDSLRSE